MVAGPPPARPSTYLVMNGLRNHSAYQWTGDIKMQGGRPVGLSAILSDPATLAHSGYCRYSRACPTVWAEGILFSYDLSRCKFPLMFSDCDHGAGLIRCLSASLRSASDTRMYMGQASHDANGILYKKPLSYD